MVTHLCGSTQRNKGILSIQCPSSNAATWTGPLLAGHWATEMQPEIFTLIDSKTSLQCTYTSQSLRKGRGKLYGKNHITRHGRKASAQAMPPRPHWGGMGVQKCLQHLSSEVCPQVNPYLFTLVVQTDDIPEEMLRSQKRCPATEQHCWSWLAQEQSSECKC